MDAWLSDEQLRLAVAGALALIVWSIGRRIAAAIEAWGRSAVALNEQKERVVVADQVTAATEQLMSDAPGDEKLKAALHMADGQGVTLAAPEVEAALKRAEATWRARC